jgi:hypothetical protein
MSYYHFNYAHWAYVIWFFTVMLIISFLLGQKEFAIGFALASLFALYVEHGYNTVVTNK